MFIILNTWHAVAGAQPATSSSRSRMPLQNKIKVVLIQPMTILGLCCDDHGAPWDARI